MKRGSSLAAAGAIEQCGRVHCSAHMGFFSVTRNFPALSLKASAPLAPLLAEIGPRVYLFMMLRSGGIAKTEEHQCEQNRRPE
jgi:hypothetical protein